MLDKAYWKDISKKIIVTGKELGFNDVGISDTVINQNQGLYKEWIDAKNHGAMSYLEDHQDIKFDPENILANTKSIISVNDNNAFLNIFRKIFGLKIYFFAICWKSIENFRGFQHVRPF